ncbi:MAG: helix-turn-helix domain-containing protein [Patescibacteria group bacterium]|nr:helix-turn-helix domain-containing protein [Patescibacteria group bacterium]
MKDLKECLAEYGLSDKESLVYLSMLELGPASVQDIAKKSGVNRATTYVMIESLKRRGLMSTFDQGKKTMFVAESPERLKRLIEKDVRLIQEKEDRLKEALPSFLALYNSSTQEKPIVKFFEGEEGVRSAREIMMQTRGEMLNFVAINEETLSISKIDERQRVEAGKRIHGKIIMAIKEGLKSPYFDRTNWEVKHIAYESYPFTGDLHLFDNKVLYIIMKAKPIAFLLESPEVYALTRAMYEAVWRCARSSE